MGRRGVSQLVLDKYTVEELYGLWVCLSRDAQKTGDPWYRLEADRVAAEVEKRRRATS